MKKILSIVCLLSLSLTGLAQEKINYTVLQDDVSSLPWLSMNLDIFGMELTVPKGTFGINFGLGLWGHVENPKLPVTIQYSVYRSYLDFNTLLLSQDYKQTTEVQAGAILFLRDKTVKTNVSIGLDNETISEERYGNEIRRTSRLTSITIPAHKRTQFGFRGGLIFRNAGFPIGENLHEDLSLPDLEPYEFASHTSTSIYAGILNRVSTNVVIKTDKYGVSKTGSKSTNWFLDAVFAPVNSFNHPSGDDINAVVKEATGGFPIGARFGYQTYAIEKRKYTGKKFGFAARGEMGYRPYIGYYASVTLGLTIIKAKK